MKLSSGSLAAFFVKTTALVSIFFVIGDVITSARTVATSSPLLVCGFCVVLDRWMVGSDELMAEPGELPTFGGPNVISSARIVTATTISPLLVGVFFVVLGWWIGSNELMAAPEELPTYNLRRPMG